MAVEPCRRSGTAPSLEPGTVVETTAIEDLPRSLMVQYAGASGDYNPLHTDEVYATVVAGYPTVVAHGMLTMGITGRVLTDLVGDGRLRTFGGRFHAPVLPGNSLTVRVEVGDTTVLGDGVTVVELAFTTRTGDGRTVFAGTATATWSDVSRTR
ncbi:MaoC/PaaZ C-terminal domain-containing protein [Pseudonocardia sp. GCM10023141]|uniref:MaoC/PaaZ C-terminal domain-containing protein n=1 Tax=Pseudonocardia sp. GCM10023141 TaxID=3252653 RepID=UPI0036196099